MPSKTSLGPTSRQQPLRTKRLELVPLTPQHQADLYALDADPAVMRYIGFGKPLSESDSETGLKCLLDLAEDGLGAWAGYAGADFVGWWVLAAAPAQTEAQTQTQTQTQASQAESPPTRSEDSIPTRPPPQTDSPQPQPPTHLVFGLRISPRFWRRGYGTEGTRALFRHAFSALGAEQISGDAMTVNAGSRAAMAACGMTHVRTFHNEYDSPPPGIEEGEVEYRITRGEWEEGEGEGKGV
ncbi:unnamed protein product [Diplocarpon coronariae]